LFIQYSIVIYSFSFIFFLTKINIGGLTPKTNYKTK
jgi:hypothetical protein